MIWKIFNANSAVSYIEIKQVPVATEVLTLY